MTDHRTVTFPYSCYHSRYTFCSSISTDSNKIDLGVIVFMLLIAICAFGVLFKGK